MLTQTERHKAQLAAVIPYATMDELPGPVLDQVARLRRDLKVVWFV